MANYTELIDKYLNNELSEQERISFEDQLKTNAELKKEFELQLQTIKGVQRVALKKEVSKSITKTKLTKTITKALIATTIAVAVFGTGYYVKKKLQENETGLKYELNEQGNKNWSEADKVLPSQVFNINPKRDTVIETGGGILFAIEAGTFLNKFGEAETENIEIEIKEALNAYDIMKAGLSTTSNGALLETGGMFYINARKGKDNLEIDQQKPIQTSVPYSGTRDDMMLFDGERKPDGSINWINPIPTTKQLTCTEITKLDFYPPHYIDSLRQWGKNYKNKKYTDSLYYSFICANYPANVPVATDTSHYDIDFSKIYEYSDSLTKAAITENINFSKDYNSKTSFERGNLLFQQNCAACHSMSDQKISGPGLKGITNRTPKGRWLFEYIKNNEKLLKSGDAYANKILRENGNAPMTVFEGTLSDLDIEAIERYLIETDLEIKLPQSNTDPCQQINPALIQAIWDPKFNNTILATKEFEERLPSIFRTCNNAVLELYTQNLNCKLYILDSIAATLCNAHMESSESYSTQVKEDFLNFYKRYDGGVNIDNKQIFALQRYAAERKALYEKIAQSTLIETAKKEKKIQALLNNQREQFSFEELKRESSNLKEEFEINLKEAYRQIGKPFNPNPPPQSVVTGRINNTGWKNVDAYVLESIVSRTTLNYTDPGSGKKAVIKYQKVEVRIDNKSDFDRVVVYLIPDKLNSFQRMNFDGKQYNENLNELMKYELIAVGFKDEKTFYYKTENLLPQSYSFKLKEIEPKELTKFLNNQNSTSQRSDLTIDLNYQQFEQKEAIRQKKIQDDLLFRQKVWQVIFPCTNYIEQ